MAAPSTKTLSTQDFRCEIKDISEETGTFTGFASVYGITDLGGDVVEKGAFKRSINARKAVPILWQHSAPIGLGELEDSDKGLIVKGKLTLEVNTAKEALALMKAGVVRGLSIGFQSVKDSVVDGIRHLHEVKLWEVSLVTFPMLPAAQVTSVKKAGDMEIKMDFAEALDNLQTMRGMYMSLDALSTALYDCLYDQKLSTDECVSMMQQSVEQFGEQVAALTPKIRALMNSEYGYNFKRLFEIEKKAGRKISAANRSKIEEAIKQLQALLEEATADDAEESGSTTSPEIKAVQQPPEPAPQPTDPVSDHSALIDQMKGALHWSL